MKLFLSLVLFAAFLLCPAACADGVRDGLTLAARAALPALFPFFVAGGLLVRTGVCRCARPRAGAPARPSVPAAARGRAGGRARPDGRLSGRRGDRCRARAAGRAHPRGRGARQFVLQLRQPGLLHRSGRAGRVRQRAHRRCAVRHPPARRAADRAVHRAGRRGPACAGPRGSRLYAAARGLCRRLLRRGPAGCGDGR